MKVVLSHPTGNTFVRAAARGLHEGALLGAFYTTIAAPDPRVLTWMPGRIRRQILRRRYDEIPQDLIFTQPWLEMARLAASGMGLTWPTRPGAWANSDAVFERFDRHVAREIDRLPANAPVSAVYSYEDSADHTFQAARDRGFRRIYELPIAYWQTTRRLLREEAERMPEWRRTLGGIDDPPQKLERKTREIEQADTVVVPSQFVLATLPYHIRRNKRCLVAPFGSPAPRRGCAEREQPGRRRLRILFAGTMTQRKGLGDLFAAMRLLKRSDVELVVMGTPQAPLSFYRRQYADFIYEPPRPHRQVLTLMQRCDVLALPAIVEGRALVQQEALASGLPLVVTANAGGEDLVEEGRTGFLVPPRSPEALADRLAWFAEHPAQLAPMRLRAMQKAAETGWPVYEARVREAVMR